MGVPILMLDGQILHDMSNGLINKSGTQPTLHSNLPHTRMLINNTYFTVINLYIERYKTAI